MNNTRRAALKSLGQDLTNLQGQLEELMQEEQDYLDAMPESIQSGDKGTQAESIVDTLQGAVDSLVEAYDAIEEAQQ